MRLFFALDIQQEDKQAIAQWQEALHNKLISAEITSFKPIVANNFHVTLAFLGAVDNDQYQQLVQFADMLLNREQLARIITTQPPKISLTKLGLFKQPKVLYLGLSETPNWLETLAVEFKEKAKSLSIFQEERPYLAHLSLFRKATFVPDVLPLKTSLCIKSISLYQSINDGSGVVYRPINTWPLTKKFNKKLHK